MSWVLRLALPRQIELHQKKMSREDFFAWLWQFYSQRGLEGIHEGTVLSEQAAEWGLETDSWTVDSGEAPRERDWVGGRGDRASVELYWTSEKQARAAARDLGLWSDVEIGECQLIPERDWDAEWKKSFRGVDIGPGVWKIIPPWEKGESEETDGATRSLVLNPGAGFGTGTHETTQLCLLALAEVFSKKCGKIERVLDFGSGSGILAMGAAQLGAPCVEAVEIDMLAIDNAVENARLNGLEHRIVFARTLAELGAPKKYDIILANILRPVLLEFCSDLVSRLQPDGVLILSGLIESDLSFVQEAYQKRMSGSEYDWEVRSLGEWRAVRIKRSRSPVRAGFPQS